MERKKKDREKEKRESRRQRNRGSRRNPPYFTSCAIASQGHAARFAIRYQSRMRLDCL